MSYGFRSPLPQDIPALVAHLSHPAVVAGLGHMPYPTEAWVREKVVEKNPNLHMIVATFKTEAIGLASLRRHAGRQSHAGIIETSIRVDHQGKGVGRAIKEELLDIADNWLGLIRVESEVIAGNMASIKINEALGFHQEGIKQKAVMTQGELKDIVLMARLKAGPGL